MHGQKDTRGDLNDEYKQCQRTEHVPKIEVFGRVIFPQVLVVKLAGRKSVVYPVQRFFSERGICGYFFEYSHN